VRVAWTDNGSGAGGMARLLETEPAPEGHSGAGEVIRWRPGVRL
jgi:hypothetical protein